MSKTRSRTKRAVESSARVVGIEAEIAAWQAQALPDASTPLEAEDVARLVRSFVEAFGAADAGESFSVNTVHYYRRKDILDEPEGRTAAARYGLHHVWQAVGARLAGFLGLVTLAEARDVVRGAPDATLRQFVAERVADVRARAATRGGTTNDAPSIALDGERRESTPRPVPEPATTIATSAAMSSGATASVIALGGDALCLIPSDHPALVSRAAARALIDALARALGVHKS